MKTFEFDGQWKTKIELPLFSKLRDPFFINPTSHHESVRDQASALRQNIVDLKIADAPNKNEYPEEIQLTAINYLINNEHEIYAEVFRVTKEIVYPHYSELCGENFSEHAPLNSTEDLPIALGINEIYIDFIGKNDIAWITFGFGANVDPEHGLSMLFERDQFLKHESQYDMNYKDLLAPELYDKYISDINKHHNASNAISHYPDANKRFYKPWALEQTKYYILNLIKENKIQEFESIVSHKDFDINIKFPEMDLTIAEEISRLGRPDLAKKLESIKGEN